MIMRDNDLSLVLLLKLRTYMHGKLHETKQCLIN